MKGLDEIKHENEEAIRKAVSERARHGSGPVVVHIAVKIQFGDKEVVSEKRTVTN